MYRERATLRRKQEEDIGSILIAFKIDLENKLQPSIANKLFNEYQTKPVGQPKLPSLNILSHAGLMRHGARRACEPSEGREARIRGKEARTGKECHRARLLLRLHGGREENGRSKGA